MIGNSGASKLEGVAPLRLALAQVNPTLGDLDGMRANVARIRATRAALTAGLERLGYGVLPSEANFVLARRPGEDQAPVARALAAGGILVRNFPVPRLADALRITVGTDDEVAALLAALARL